jgi:hypothetical protein
MIEVRLGQSDFDFFGADVSLPRGGGGDARGLEVAGGWRLVSAISDEGTQDGAGASPSRHPRRASDADQVKWGSARNDNSEEQ